MTAEHEKLYQEREAAENAIIQVQRHAADLQTLACQYVALFPDVEGEPNPQDPRMRKNVSAKIEAAKQEVNLPLTREQLLVP